MAEITVNQKFENIEQIVKAIDEKLATMDKNQSSERIEAIENQIADIQKVLEESKKQKVTHFNGEEAWGVKDVSSIPEGLTAKQIHHNVLIKSPGQSEIIKGFQTINDDVMILSGLLKGFGSGKTIEQLDYWKTPSKELGGYSPNDFIEKTGLGKALSSVSGNSGANWVPQGWSSEMLHDYENDLMLHDVFQSFDMPQDPYNYPFIDGSGIQSYIRSESTSDEPSKYRSSEPTDANIQFSTKEFAVRVLYTRKLDEDAIVTWLPELKRKITRRMAEDVEDAIINGDVTATHMDTDVTLSMDHRKAWKGLRKWANAESGEYDVTTGGTTFQASDGMRVQEKMGKFAIRTTEGVWVMSFPAYIQARAFDEFETVDMAGARASIFTGQVGFWYGFPVITSAFVRTDLNATGVYQSGQTKTEFLGIHHPSFRIGYRREEDVESERDIDTGLYKIVATMRLHFNSTLPTGNVIVGAGINV